MANEKKINVILDGKQVEAFDGERLASIIKRNGIFISAPCYHESLTETGHCGLCLVGARRKSSDDFTVLFACTATAKDGVEIDTRHPDALRERNKLLFMSLLSHPMDCSKCNKVGDCFLHKIATQTKFRGFSRIKNGELNDVEYTSFGEKILFDSCKCIGCQLCIRFFRDILNEDKLGMFLNAAGYKEVGLYPGKTLDGNYSINVVDLCPAGALISKKSLFQPFDFELMRTPSISTGSSTGVNTYLMHDGEKVFRIVPRRNQYVNDCWMPDSEREEYENISKHTRLRRVIYNGARSQLEHAILHIVETLKNTGADVVCSGKMSLEEQFILHELLSSVVSDVHFLKKNQKSDGFLISDDASPNFNGALLTGLIKNGEEVHNLNRLNEKIKNRQTKAIIIIDEEIFDYGVSYVIPDDIKMFYIGTRYEKTAKRSIVNIPISTVFEKTGTFINKDWRLQKFYKAIKPPTNDVFPLWRILSFILDVYFTQDARFLRLEDLWKAMTKEISELKDIDLKNLSESGILLKKY